MISSAGVRPDPERVAALRSLPAPTDVASLRRVLGLFNYLHKFLPDMANISSPMRALLRHDTAWLWDAAQQAAFDKLKTLASQACSLSFFDPARPAVISADASSYGLGATLLQRQGDDMVLIAYASKSLNDTQQQYAQIEKELLAVTWACEHFAQYLLGGQPVTVQTDHKPLVPLINTRDLDNVPLRCQRMLMRLLQYHASAVYVPGPRLVVADTLSRAPTGPCNPLPHTCDLLSDVDVLVASVATDHASPAFQTRLQAATAADATLSEVSHNVLHGWPGRERDIAHPLRSFFAARLGLSVADGCVYYNTRLVIPASMQAEVLRTLHDGHQGITKCRARARSAVWWPGLDAQIADMVSNCEVCSKERPTGTRRSNPSLYLTGRGSGLPPTCSSGTTRTFCSQSTTSRSLSRWTTSGPRHPALSLQPSQPTLLAMASRRYSCPTTVHNTPAMHLLSSWPAKGSSIAPVRLTIHRATAWLSAPSTRSRACCQSRKTATKLSSPTGPRPSSAAPRQRSF